MALLARCAVYTVHRSGRQAPALSKRLHGGVPADHEIVALPRRQVAEGRRLDRKGGAQMFSGRVTTIVLRVWFSRSISREFLYEHSLTVRSFDRVATLGDSVT